MDDVHSLLSKAREEIANGNGKVAVQKLTAILEQDRNNADAWLLLADVLENPKHRIESLKRVLKITPDNIVAKKRLDELLEPEKARAAGEKPNVTSPPRVRTNPKRKPKRTVWMVIGFLTLLIICLCALIPLFPVVESTGSSPTEAKIMCETLIKASLVAPTTARFSGILDTRMGSVANQPNTYRVIGYVDAQNSFGAQIRNYYTCEIKYNGGEWTNPLNWTLLRLDLD